MSDIADNFGPKVLPHALSIYRSRPERAALRCALGDAAHLCDAISRAIEAEHRGRNGKGAVTKQGKALATIAMRCGDEIWKLRDMVGFEDELTLSLDPRVCRKDEG